MGIAADLQYSIPPPNALQRLSQLLAASRGGARVFAKTLPYLDDAVGWLTRGRQSTAGLLSGLPVADLTTTGRRSGQPRTTHLICIPIADSFALVGTNFGRPATPDWVYNLEREPRASLAFRGTVVEVVARPATAAELEQVMTAAARIFAGYGTYQQRITGRRVRVFVLEPA